ncbi:MAG: GH3 auxin-responsive promoter family protein [Prevotellaceae bacterium]|nr:GH3 auxin-responsive promoter family protein [Prevotellaceae bacterium]
MSIVNSIFNLMFKNRLTEIDVFRKNPFAVQEEQLLVNLDAAKDTEFGKRYDFQSISSIETFQQRVPLHEYGNLRPYIERMMNGENNVLCGEEVKWFAKSSGTTAEKSKFIPVPEGSLEECHYRGGKDVLTFYLNRFPESNILTGKGLTLGGSHQVTSIGANTYAGDLSAILIDNAPFLAELVRTPSREVALISDFEEKIKRIAEETLKEDVVQFAGVPSWNLVLMRYLLSYAGKNNLLEIWPNLELFIHGGVNFTPYREQFQAIIPSPGMRYMETYNASEGFFGIQDDLNDSGMLLMLDYKVFYEFIPMSTFGTENPTYCTIADVQKGVNYALVITTNGGLWRYLIGDTVEFTSLFPHKIKITGRTKHYINVFGEELVVDNAESALRTACQATNATIKEYTVAPVFMQGDEKGGHEWLIEFENIPTNLTTFTTLLDQALCAANSDYEAKRKNNTTLNMPLLHALKPGTFYEWMRQRGKLGGQNKVPRLYNTREYVEQLMEINESL